MSLLQLAFSFFYIGLFTIGGGQVAITLMQQSIVSSGLISQAQFYNMVAISESTPYNSGGKWLKVVKSGVYHRDRGV